MSANIIDPTRVVLKLRTLALSPSNRAVICRRGVPASLVQFLNQSQPGSQVSALAIETLYLLSEEESNLQLLASEPNLLSTVQHTFACITSEDGHGGVTERAASPLNTQSSAHNDHQGGVKLEDEFVLKMKKNMEHHCEELLKRLQPQDVKTQDKKEKEKMRKKHTVQFQLDNLVQNRKTIENVLLKNSGTISYKFNIEGDYVSVYTRSKTENLIVELSEFGKVTVLQDSICETEYNNENVLNVNNGKKPEYLKRDNSSSNNMSDYKKSLVSVSREDRLKKRKETSKSSSSSAQKKAEEDNGGGFLKKLTSVFW